MTAKTMQRSMPENIIADAISALVGDPTIKNNASATAGAVIMARQIIIALEKHGYASKGQVEKCFALLSIMEREA